MVPFKTPKVICGFPGVGKSTLFNKGLNCTDSDSSKFDKQFFPQNYIDYIKALIANGEHDYIFVSTHSVVRSALVAAGIKFTVVYPSIDQRDEYLARYVKRGSPQAFVDLMKNSWTSFIVDCAEQSHCERIVLRPGEFLADVL